MEALIFYKFRASSYWRKNVVTWSEEYIRMTLSVSQNLFTEQFNTDLVPCAQFYAMFDYEIGRVRNKNLSSWSNDSILLSVTVIKEKTNDMSVRWLHYTDYNLEINLPQYHTRFSVYRATIIENSFLFLYGRPPMKISCSSLQDALTALQPFHKHLLSCVFNDKIFIIIWLHFFSKMEAPFLHK